VITLKKAALILLLVLSCGFSQEQSEIAFRRDSGGLNGRQWQSMTYLDKFHYLLGATDAILEAAPTEYSKYFDVQSGLTFGEFTKAVDRFYEEPENLPIPIVWAARVVTMKTNGATAKELDQILSSMRRQALKKSN
jgi:hypothetical protein